MTSNEQEIIRKRAQVADVGGELSLKGNERPERELKSLSAESTAYFMLWSVCLT